jgi:hypothetical protein
MRRSQRSARTGGKAGAALLAGVGLASFSLVAMAPAASAAGTLGATATIASPAQGNPPLASGGSATVFTVLLPAQAACSQDTASHEYHVFSYLLQKGTALSTDNFVSGDPSEGLGLVDANGNYYGAADTAPVSGQIIGIPSNFEWAGLLKVGEAAAQLEAAGGVWEAGIACADPSGAVTDNWNTEVTFTAASGDPNGFTWTAVPGTGTTTGVPGAPTSPSVTQVKKNATVTWTDPTSNGGSPITGYDVYASTTNPPSTSGAPSATASGANATSATVKKLKKGKYFFVVTAVNSKGQSPPSPVVTAADATKTTVKCSSTKANVNATVTCTAKVTDATTPSSVPSGTVTWKSSGAGTFTPAASCALSSGSCAVTYEPTAAGKQTLTASYPATAQDLASTGTAKLKVSAVKGGTVG